MQRIYQWFIMAAPLLMAACAPPPPVDQSREILWDKFAHQPVDNLLMEWGAPERETRLTDGSRLLTYQHSTTYDSGAPSERTSGCEVSSLAKAPTFRIENIAMQGDAYECHLLAQGRTGNVREATPPPVYPYNYPYPYRTYPF